MDTQRQAAADAIYRVLRETITMLLLILQFLTQNRNIFSGSTTNLENCFTDLVSQRLFQQSGGGKMPLGILPILFLSSCFHIFRCLLSYGPKFLVGSDGQL